MIAIAFLFVRMLCDCFKSRRRLEAEILVVCTENLILVDYVTESPNVNGDDRAALFPPDPVRLAVQVEEPT